MKGWFPALNEAAARPTGRPLLAISDVHGDLVALEAVLDSVAELDLCGIVAAGDHCFGGPEPFGVWQRLKLLGATMVRGETDIALGALRAAAQGGGRPALVAGRPTAPYVSYTPSSLEEEVRLAAFLETREALGEIVCRRLAELPSTAVVSLDGRAGVMVTHGSPADEWRSLTPELTEIELVHEVSSTAEDVLVTGRCHRPFLRQAGPVLVVGAGSVGESPVTTASGKRTAHAVLIQEFSDGTVRARPRDVIVERPSQHQPPKRKAG